MYDMMPVKTYEEVFITGIVRKKKRARGGYAMQKFSYKQQYRHSAEEEREASVAHCEQVAPRDVVLGGAHNPAVVQEIHPALQRETGGFRLESNAIAHNFFVPLKLIEMFKLSGAENKGGI